VTGNQRMGGRKKEAEDFGGLGLKDWKRKGGK